MWLPMQDTPETWVRSLGREDPLEKEMATPYSILAWRIHGQRSLAGYSPWGRKELDMTEHTPHTHTEKLKDYKYNWTYVCAKQLQSCWSLCDPMDCSPPGSSVPGILQAGTLEGIAMPPPGDLPDSGIKLVSLASPVSASRFFSTGANWEAHSWTHVYSRPLPTSH